jgi:adenine-specific DNA-methyltransferase
MFNLPDNGLLRFQDLLREFFQLDSADLDFGVPRILSFKRKQVEDFISRRLPQKVDETLARYRTADRTLLTQRLENLKEEIRKDFGNSAIDQNGRLLDTFSATPLGREYNEQRQRLEQESATEEVKIRVFNDLYTFFRRYYEGGDFICKPRIRSAHKETYAIPYNGEEVAFHWATRGDYYAKTSEHFKAYQFKIDDCAITLRVQISATYESGGNGDIRYLFLASRDPVEESGKHLDIRFERRPPTKEEAQVYSGNEIQPKLNISTEQRILGLIRDEQLKGALARQNAGHESILLKHIARFAQRNNTDFFVNKNLRVFLNQELDSYIKSDCLQLDELLGEPSIRVMNLAHARLVKEIGQTIIDFLSQIEDFQRGLFEKRKFVIRTEYCLTVDRVPEQLFDEILKNDAQVREWRELCSLDSMLRQAGKISVDKEFLEQHSSLMIDTRHFSEQFKQRLIESFEDLDEGLDGILLKSENFQALNLLSQRLGGNVDCIYIDPPYNTGSTKILYKNQYEHSSWLCLMENSLARAMKLLRPGGILEIAIDDYEGHRLRSLVDMLLTEDNRLGTITVLHNPGGRHDDKFIATAHEYMLVYSNDKNQAATRDLPLSEEDVASFRYTDPDGQRYRLREFRRSGSHSKRVDRPHMYYSIYYDPNTGKASLEKESEKSVEILPIDPKGTERVWRWGKQTLSSKISDLVVEENQGQYSIKVKKYLRDKSGLKPKSVWTDPSYSSALGTMRLKNLFGREDTFPYPKSPDLVADALRIATEEQSVVLDFFAGSGTTADAIIGLNREDGGQRNYVLIEMGEWFDSIILPRVKKVVFCDDPGLGRRAQRLKQWIVGRDSA